MARRLTGTLIVTATIAGAAALYLDSEPGTAAAGGQAASPSETARPEAIPAQEALRSRRSRSTWKDETERPLRTERARDPAKNAKRQGASDPARSLDPSGAGRDSLRAPSPHRASTAHPGNGRFGGVLMREQRDQRREEQGIAAENSAADPEAPKLEAIRDLLERLREDDRARLGLLGRGQEEMRQALGVPDAVQRGDEHTEWTYWDRTATGKIGSGLLLRLLFEGDSLAEITGR